MRGIILDLETQRLFKEVKKILRNVSHLHKEELSALGEKGIPSPPPWLVAICDRPLDSIVAIFNELEKNSYTLSPEIWYDPEWNELDVCYSVGEGSSGEWRSLMTRKLGLSVAITWDEAYDFRIWLESQAIQLVDELSRFPYIVGANLLNFDYCVLERYVRDTREKLGYKTIDLLAHAQYGLFISWIERELNIRDSQLSSESLMSLWQQIRGNRKFEIWDAQMGNRERLRVPGYRISLDALAKDNIGRGKTGKSINAPTLFQEGKLEELIIYCKNDVELTMDLFLSGSQHGTICLKDYVIPIRWGAVSTKLEETPPPPSFFCTTEWQCSEFQESLLPDKLLTSLEISLKETREEERRKRELEWRQMKREWRRQNRERQQRDPTWIKRQEELKKIRQLRQEGKLISGTLLARELGVKTHTIALWARKLNIKPCCTGVYYYTIDEADLIRSYGNSSRKGRAKILLNLKKQENPEAC